MTGKRKSNKINSLMRLNSIHKLGFTEKEIENMTTGQLRKNILRAKLSLGITVHPMTKIPRGFKVE